MTKWILPPFLSFFFMLVYAGAMGKDRLKEYPIGNELLLWEEYLIIVGICYLYVIVRKLLPTKSQNNP